MARPLADYESTFNKVVRELGVGKRTQVTAPEIAAIIGEPPGRVVRTLEVAKKAGSIEFAFDDKRRPHYTVIDGDFKSTEARMAERGLAWSSWQEKNVSPADEAARNGRTDHSTKPQTIGRSMDALSVVRKSEPRAEIEVARKFRDQQAFIEQQRKMFTDMGLELPAIPETMPPDRKLELTAIVRILPYVESVEHANEILEQQNKTIRVPQAELSELRASTTRQREQIERLVREKAEIKEDVQKMMGDHRREVETLREQISQLESQLRQIRGNRQINGAVARTELADAAAAAAKS